jgi:hypothetical protein
MKQERVNVFGYLGKLFKKTGSPFARVWVLKPRVIICSAKEAIPRWAGLQIEGEGSLAAYIKAAEAIKNPEWEKALETIKEIISAGSGAKSPACPFHGRRSA